MESITNNCWNQIGITGDKSCPQLKEVIHCRNCSVYSSAGRAFFQREPPVGYLEEWTNLLSQPLPAETIKSEQSGTSSQSQLVSLSQKDEHLRESNTSVIIFRLEEEWFALPVEIVKEITPVFTVHTLPHRSNNILGGIVNIRGEILTYISLTDIFKLKKYNPQKPNLGVEIKNNSVTYKRMIVIEIQENRWVFKTDELDSVYRFNLNDFQDCPTAISKKFDTYTKKIITLNQKKINYLDTELLFYELLFYTYARPK